MERRDLAVGQMGRGPVLEETQGGGTAGEPPLAGFLPSCLGSGASPSPQGGAVGSEGSCPFLWEVSWWPGSLGPRCRVAVEVVTTMTSADVMWQDGSVECSIRSNDLFPVHHLDNNEFCPGDFVVDKRGRARQSLGGRARGLGSGRLPRRRRALVKTGEPPWPPVAQPGNQWVARPAVVDWSWGGAHGATRAPERGVSPPLGPQSRAARIPLSMAWCSPGTTWAAPAWSSGSSCGRAETTWRCVCAAPALRQGGLWWAAGGAPGSPPSVPTQLIGEEEDVSVYDIADHPDFRFRTTDIVIRIGNTEDGAPHKEDEVRSPIALGFQPGLLLLTGLGGGCTT